MGCIPKFSSDLTYNCFKNKFRPGVKGYFSNEWVESVIIYVISEFGIFINMNKAVLENLSLARATSVFQKKRYDLNRPVMLGSSPDHKVYLFEIS